MIEILWNRICSNPFKLRPYKFSGVKFGCVTGKEICVDSAMPFKPFLNNGSPMNKAFIPQKDNRTFDMTQDIVQKPFDLRRLDILARMESDIQGEALSLGRCADSGDGRYLCPVSRDRQMGSLSSRRPSAPDIGNQKKAALVKKYQMGASPIGVFLYAAIRSVSSAGWPSRRAPGLSFRASGSSSQDPLENARDDWDDTLYRIFSLLPRQCVSGSIDRYCIQAKEALLTKFVSVPSFGWASFFADARVPALASMLLRLLSGTFASRGILRLVNSQASLLWPTGYNRFSAALWRVGAAFRVAFGFHMVSCI